MEKMTMKQMLIFVLVLSYFMYPVVTYAENYNAPPNANNTDYLIQDWEQMPHKDQRANVTWVNYVNTYYNKTWNNKSYNDGAKAKFTFSDFQPATDYYDLPVIGEIYQNKEGDSDNERNEVVVTTTNKTSTRGRVFALYYDHGVNNYEQLWSYPSTGSLEHPDNASLWRVKGEATIADIDNDGQNEVLFAVGNTTYALYGHNGSIKYKYEIPWPTYDSTTYDMDIHSLTVSDIDNDGKKEIMFATVAFASVPWDPEVHIFNYEDVNSKRGVSHEL